MKLKIGLRDLTIGEISMKDFKAKLVGSILILLLGLPVTGQGPECLFVQFDKSFYVSGETMWYKAYLMNDSGIVKSRVLHVDLVSHNNETIVSQKLLIDNRTSDGSIAIPMESEEGNYRFRAYTTYNLGFEPASIFQKIIPVYQPNKEDFLQTDQIKKETGSLLNKGDISIVSDNQLYQPRDSLTLSFQINESIDTVRKGNFSVAVVPLEVASLEFESHDHSKCSELSIGTESTDCI